jgi:hypothetical protein
MTAFLNAAISAIPAVLLMRRLRFIAVVAILMLTACPGPPTARDKNDTTPPKITLSVTASTNTADGTEIVAPGSTVKLKPPGGSALIKADNAKGVAWVEIWMTQEKTCNGVKESPGLAGAPAKHVDGNVTDTSAPSSLTAGVDINLLQLVHGCSYKFEVWGKAANAATTPVIAQSGFADLTLLP